MDKRTATPGRFVTVKHAVPAYYSGYAGRPKMLIKAHLISEIVCNVLLSLLFGVGIVAGVVCLVRMANGN